jgi:hypothetical protein
MPSRAAAVTRQRDDRRSGGGRRRSCRGSRSRLARHDRLVVRQHRDDARHGGRDGRPRRAATLEADDHALATPVVERDVDVRRQVERLRVAARDRAKRATAARDNAKLMTVRVMDVCARFDSHTCV